LHLLSIEINNYRCFDQLALALEGESLVLVGPNAAGKSTLLNAVRLALQGGLVTRDDFRDPEAAVELTATLSGISPAAQGVFAEAIDFDQTPPVLRLTLQVIWNQDEAELETNHVFPDDGWRRVGREAREAIPLMFLPGWRDPARLLALLGEQSILAGLVDQLPLEDDLQEAIAAITATGEALSQADPFRQLMAEGREELARLLPRVPEEAFSVGALAAQPSELLRQLHLLLAMSQSKLPVGSQSGGLGQASVFAFALRALSGQPDSILLVDEPENALHPQAQRALLATLRGGSAQSLITTHSAAVLDRGDPRRIARLSRDEGNGAGLSRAAGLDTAEAASLSRYSTSLTAEAYFAETVIFVEGFSDFLAVRTFAAALGIDLDGSGVSLLSLEGADLLKHYLALFGPNGLRLNLRGLCDLDKEAEWISRLDPAGIAVTDRASLNAAGFQVSDPDLEAELLVPLSEEEIANVFTEAGAEGRFEAFQQQPANAGMSVAELQLAFVKSNKIKWAPLIASAIAVDDIPTSITALLGGL
jgi:energy-coupling factor transporter ATP-binding protein EcfA2